MQMLEICRKSESIQSFSYENTVNEGANEADQSMCAAMNVFFH